MHQHRHLRCLRLPLRRLTLLSPRSRRREIICRDGDVEDLDIVANYGWIRSGMWDEVEADIKAVCDVCHKYGSNVKGYIRG